MDHEAGPFRHLTRWAFLGVVLAVTAIAFTAPRSAGAFVGENLVIDPATGQLTKAAESLLKQGRTLPEIITEAKNFAGASEAGEAAAVFEGAGVMPALGSVLAFGVGTEIGKEICGVLGIEGCWSISSLFADPTETVEGKWEWFAETTPTGWETETPFSWYWKRGSAYRFVYTGLGGVSEKCGVAPPKDFTAFVPEASTTGCKGESAKNGVVRRSGMANRKMDYHETDTAQENYSFTPNSKWQELLAKALKGKASGTPEGRVGEKIAEGIDPKVHDPYVPYVTIPSCSGLLWGSCKVQLEELKLVPERLSLDWKTAVVELEPGAVTTLSPSPGSEVKTATKVVVTTNPDEKGMPLVIPQPKPGETYDAYIARLAPGLKPHRVNVCEACSDPSYGPNVVLETDPTPKTRVNPETGGEVEVRTNPPDVPAPLPAWSPPGIPPIDTSPLGGLKPCGVFPFGLLCWFGEGLEQFNTSGKCPKAAIGIPGIGGGGSSTFNLSVCGETTEEVMEYVRPAELLFFIIGLGFLFAKATGALGGND